MSEFETVSASRKGRPLRNSLKSERKRLELDRDEKILLGLSSFLSNGPGKQLSRNGGIDGETAEELLREAEAVRRAGIEVDQNQDPEEIYRELAEEVGFLEGENKRAYFDSATLGGVEISGRSPEDDPLDSEAEIVYMNIDQVPEKLIETENSLEEAAFRRAEESGLEFMKRVEESEVYWSELSSGEYQKIAVPDSFEDTVGQLLKDEGYDVATFSEIETEYGLDPEALEDEEELPSKADELALCYIVDSGSTAEQYGIQVEEEDKMFETYLAAFT
jgi:hypothetical protein